MKLYNEDQIKEAFWKTFHQQGEIFFPYQSRNPGDGEDVTRYYFKEFLEYLNKIQDNNSNRAGSIINFMSE